jgi:hypothetical protein
MMTRDAMRCGRMFSQKINVFVHTAEPSRTSWDTHVTGGRQRFPLSRIPRHAFPCTCGMHTPTPPCENTPCIHSVCTLQGGVSIQLYPHTPPCKLCHMHTPCAPHREGCLYLPSAGVTPLPVRYAETPYISSVSIQGGVSVGVTPAMVGDQ